MSVQQTLNQQESKPKSILEDSLKVIQGRQKKQLSPSEQQLAIDKVQTSLEKMSLKELQDEQKTIDVQTDRTQQSHQQSFRNLQRQSQELKVQDKMREDKTNLQSSKSTIKSCARDQHAAVEQNDENKNIKITQNIKSQSESRGDIGQGKSESKRYSEEKCEYPQENNNNKSFYSIGNGHSDHQLKSQHEFENLIGVQNVDQNTKGHRLISPIPYINPTSTNNNQNITEISSQFEDFSKQQSNYQEIVNTEILGNQNKSPNVSGQKKQIVQSKRYISPASNRNQGRNSSEQKQKDHDKLKLYANRVKSNNSLHDKLPSTSPTTNETIGKSQSSQQSYPHFRMDGNYFKKQSNSDGKQQFYEQSNQSLLEIKELKKKQQRMQQERISQQKQQTIKNNSNQANNLDTLEKTDINVNQSSGKQLFTKSFYDDENHKRFIKEKMKERKLMQMKREKSFLEQQEIIKKQEIEEVEALQKQKEIAIQERALQIQERMKRNRSYLDSIDANKSSSRERSIQKPLFVELQERFDQNQQKEAEERKKLLELAKVNKKPYNFEEIVRHDKQYQHMVLERSNSKQSKNISEWHYEKPKFQSKLYGICEKEKEEQKLKELQELALRKQKEERRHRFSQQVRDQIQSQSPNKEINLSQAGRKHRQLQSARQEKDTLDSQFINHNKYEFDNSPKIGNKSNFIEITDENNGSKRDQRKEDSKYSSILSKNEHLNSIQSLKQNISSTIDCNEYSRSEQKKQGISNKITSSQSNLNHLNNRFRGSRSIQRQYTADQFLVNSDFDTQIKQNHLHNQHNYYLKQNYKNKQNTNAHQLSQQSLAESIENGSTNFFMDYSTPQRKNLYSHQKVSRNLKERLSSANSGSVQNRVQKTVENLRTDKSNESRLTERYQDMIKLHDTNLNKKLNNKSKSIYERVQDVRKETQKMEQIANKQVELLRVSSNDEIDRTFISDIYLKSIKAKLAVLDEITPIYNANLIKIDQQITNKQNLHQKENAKHNKSISINENDQIPFNQFNNNMYNNNNNNIILTTIPSTRGILKKELKFADQSEQY